MSELKACPFCGNIDQISLCEEDKKYRWVVYCENCSATTDNWPDEKQAVLQWNTRPIEDAKDAEIKRLLDELGKIASYDALPESVEYDLVKLAKKVLKETEASNE